MEWSSDAEAIRYGHVGEVTRSLMGCCYN